MKSPDPVANFAAHLQCQTDSHTKIPYLQYVELLSVMLQAKSDSGALCHSISPKMPKHGCLLDKSSSKTTTFHHVMMKITASLVHRTLPKFINLIWAQDDLPVLKMTLAVVVILHYTLKSEKTQLAFQMGVSIYLESNNMYCYCPKKRKTNAFKCTQNIFMLNHEQIRWLCALAGLQHSTSSSVCVCVFQGVHKCDTLSLPPCSSLPLAHPETIFIRHLSSTTVSPVIIWAGQLLMFELNLLCVGVCNSKRG